MRSNNSLMPSFLVLGLVLWLLQLTTVCGQPRQQARIIGGQPASLGKWPWQVSILNEGKHDCGGSLLNREWVLSAAHCFPQNSEIDFSEYTVRLGTDRPNAHSNGGVTAKVEDVILHPRFDSRSKSGDIALLKLASPVDFTNNILPICLPTPSAEFHTNTDCWVTGWGLTKEKENGTLTFPETLQELKVPIVNRETCNHLYNNLSDENMEKDPITSDMICAGYTDVKKDACQHDSGGPLVCKVESHWFQAGIVSWGESCDDPSSPGVYTSVPFYVNWITSVIDGWLQNPL